LPLIFILKRKNRCSCQYNYDIMMMSFWDYRRLVNDTA